ncbi:MAG: hypothetical protein NT150_03580, partial [Bacteroidetes bacterium]|nr:hypothetical protein [Bacteroidota bacterium]
IKNLEINADVKAEGRFGIILNRGVVGSEITINGDVESKLNRAVIHSAANAKLTLNGKTTSYSKETIALGKSDYFSYQAGGTLVINGPVVNNWNDIRGNAIVNYNGNLILNQEAGKILVTHPDAKAIYSPLMDKTIKIQGRIFANRDLGTLAPQEDTVSVSEVVNDADYTDTINSTSITFHSPINGSTALLVAAGMVAAINSSGLPVIATDNINGSYSVRGTLGGQNFIHVVSVNLSNVQKVLPGYNLLNEIAGGEIVISGALE